MAINPQREADYVRLLQELRESGFDATHVLHQWAGTAAPLPLTALSDDMIQPVLTQMLENGVFSVVSLFKAFVQVYGQQPLKLLFIYRTDQGAFSAPHELLASFAKSIVTLHHKFQIASVSADDHTINGAGFQERLYQELFSSREHRSCGYPLYRRTAAGAEDQTAGAWRQEDGCCIPRDF